MVGIVAYRRFAYQTPPLYLNHALSIEERVTNLLGRMTLAEKVAQLIR